jgi:hypothetical protein
MLNSRLIVVFILSLMMRYSAVVSLLFLLCPFLLVAEGTIPITESEDAPTSAPVEVLGALFASGEWSNPEGRRLIFTPLPEFSNAVYVELWGQGEQALPEYQSVWKFHDINGELRWQFWRITTPDAFVGIHEDPKRRDELWMYQLRELDCCEMLVTPSEHGFVAVTRHECCLLRSDEESPAILSATVKPGEFSFETKVQGESMTLVFLAFEEK